MSEAEQIVDDAIRRNLYLGHWRDRAVGVHPAGHLHYIQPINRSGDIVTMIDGDCGLAKPSWTMTVTEFAKQADKYGLYRRVGMWSFVPFDNPAADAIEECHKFPQAAGRELYTLRKRVRELEVEIERMRKRETEEEEES